MKIYLAAHFPAQPRMKAMRMVLVLAGYTITSSWLDQPMNPVDPTREFELAAKDAAEVFEADGLILDTLDVDHRGGREAEWGMAHAWGKELILVGPVRSIFHRLAGRQFPTWREALTSLTQARTPR